MKYLIIALLSLSLLSCDKEETIEPMLSENAVLAQEGMLCTTDGYEVSLDIIDGVEVFYITTEYGRACVTEDNLTQCGMFRRGH